ncbi:MAG: hypothetical protein Kow0010_13360 [Dehalococcoidia bacterium]
MDHPDDAVLVEQARAGDQEAFAALYDRYFDAVYDFVVRMLRNRDEAADVAQDTFLKAMGALPGLTDPGRVRSWLFSIARNTALNHIERSRRSRPLVMVDEDGEEVSIDVVDTDRLGDPERAAEARAMASLVWEASAALDPRQLSILDLHLRQGLDSAEIADVLGVTKNNGYVLLNRLKSAVEEAIGAFIMWKEGRRDCPALDAALAEAEITEMSPTLRRLVNRHLKECDACRERRRKLVAPLAVFGAFAPVGAPPLVRAQILDALRGEWETHGPHLHEEEPPTGPGHDARGDGVGGGEPPAAAAGAGSGGPSTVGTVARLVASMAAGAAVLAALLLHPDSPLAINSGGTAPSIVDVEPTATETPTDGTATATPAYSPTPTPSSPPASASASPTATPSPSPSPATTPGGAVVATATPTSTPTPGPSPAATPSATPTNTATVAPSPTSTPSPSPTPCVPEVGVNIDPPTIVISLDGSPPYSRSFRILNRRPWCGELAFEFFLADPSVTWLTVQPGKGLVRTQSDGVIAQVFVHKNILESSGEGDYAAKAIVRGPANQVNIVVHTTLGTAPVIDTVSATCSANGVSFEVRAHDDYGITRASVAYQGTGGTETLDLQLSAGDARQGTWSGHTVATFFGQGYTVTIVDGGGRSASVSDPQFSCSSP